MLGVCWVDMLMEDPCCTYDNTCTSYLAHTLHVVGNNKIVSEEATDYRAEELKVDDAGVSEPVERSHDSEENADSAAMGEKHRRLRLRLERAVQSKDEAELEPAIEDVKKEKIPNCSELLDKVHNHVENDLIVR